MTSEHASDANNDVIAWLHGLGLGEYAAAFARNRIDADALKLLTDDDLKELGVVALGDRRKLMAAISTFGAESGRPTDGSAERGQRISETAPLSYTPEHLAARILSERNELKGERKHVTVLFADIQGSTTLIESVDPEEAAQKLGPSVSRMMTAVHKFEGTVNKVQGDGIMALFGAPLAHEDHAQRACLAALAMRDSIAAADEPAIELRVGLHSGDVLVRAIHNDLSIDYDAIGASVHLASRMEQMAAPGSILMTASTQTLAAGFFETRSLGAMTVKGVSREVPVFELLRRADLATRWEARSRHELTDFVGRRAELDTILRSAERVVAGLGQVIALVGEAGMGKSRLLHEVVHAPRLSDWLVVQTGTSPYGGTTAFLPLVALLRSIFGLEAGDATDNVATKIQESLRRRGAASKALHCAVRFLLDLSVEDPDWTALDPQQRRDRIIEELRKFLLMLAQERPLLLIFEDLHWIDPETQRLLDVLAGSLGAHRILLLVTYRPEYQHGWAGKSYYTRVRVDPLADENVDTMLQSLLGPSAEFDLLKRLLIERTEGRPLFIEEIVRSLKDAGVIATSEGRTRLVGQLDRIEIPGSVQDVLASRIDQLEPELKSLLQTASVIGRRVPGPLIESVTDLTASEVERRLVQLQDREFLYETGDGAHPEYLFKHALTEEVAYASLTNQTRRALHGRLVDAIETVYADRLAEYHEVLARHAYAAERWQEAHHYGLRAARKAHGRSAYQSAVDWFDKAAVALENVPESESRLADKMDVRLEMRIALWPLGQHEELERRVREAGALAERAGDTLRLAWVHNFLTAHHWQAGEHLEAIENGEKGIALGEQIGDFSVRVTTMQHLGMALLARGDYTRQTKLHQEVAEALVGETALQRHGMAGYPAALTRGFLAYGLAELGRFDEAFHWAREGVALARKVNSAMTTVWTTNNLAFTHLMSGEAEDALALMEPNFEHCRKTEVKLLNSQTAGILGRALTMVGKPDEGIAVLEEAAHPDNLAYHTEGLGYPLVWLALAMLACGRPEDGLECTRRALDIASQQGERGHEAWAQFAQAEILAALEPGSEAVRGGFARAGQLAEECQMRPLAALCGARLGIT